MSRPSNDPHCHKISVVLLSDADKEMRSENDDSRDEELVACSSMNSSTSKNAANSHVENSSKFGAIRALKAGPLVSDSSDEEEEEEEAPKPKIEKPVTRKRVPLVLNTLPRKRCKYIVQMLGNRSDEENYYSDSTYSSGLASTNAMTLTVAAFQAVLCVSEFTDALDLFVKRITVECAAALVEMPLIRELARIHKNVRNLNSSLHLADLLKYVSATAKSLTIENPKSVESVLDALFHQIQCEHRNAINTANGRFHHYPPDPVTQCFGYHMRRQYTCTSPICRHKTYVNETYNCFAVTMKRSSNEQLHDIAYVIKSTLAETFEDHVCSKCKKTKAIMKPEIVQLPQSLIVFFENSRNSPTLDLPLDINFICDDEADELSVIGTARHSPHKKPHHPLQTFRIWSNDEYDTLVYNFIGIRNYCNDESDLPTEESFTPVTHLYESPNIEAILKSFVNSLTQFKEPIQKYLNNMACNHLLEYVDIYAPQLKMSSKAFINYIEKCKNDFHLPPSLQIYAFTYLFKTVFIVQDGPSKFVKYVPLIGMQHRKQIFLLNKPMCYMVRGAPKIHTQFGLISAVYHDGDDSRYREYRCSLQKNFDTWYECTETSTEIISEESVLESCQEYVSVVVYSMTEFDNDDSDCDSYIQVD